MELRKKINLLRWNIKNKKKKIIADIIRYEPKYKEHEKDLFKRSKIDLHYLRYQCITYQKGGPNGHE